MKPVIQHSSIAAIVFAALLAASSVARTDTLEEKAQMCGGCHGENGVPQEKTTPIV